MKRKTVQHTRCWVTGKRSFETEREAERALGRARAQHFRQAESRTGTRRGLFHVEQRANYCPSCDGYHLTSEQSSARRIVSAVAV